MQWSRHRLGVCQLHGSGRRRNGIVSAWRSGRNEKAEAKSGCWERVQSGGVLRWFGASVADRAGDGQKCVQSGVERRCRVQRKGKCKERTVEGRVQLRRAGERARWGSAAEKVSRRLPKSALVRVTQVEQRFSFLCCFQPLLCSALLCCCHITVASSSPSAQPSLAFVVHTRLRSASSTSRCRRLERSCRSLQRPQRADVVRPFVDCPRYSATLAEHSHQPRPHAHLILRYPIVTLAPLSPAPPPSPSR